MSKKSRELVSFDFFANGKRYFFNVRETQNGSKFVQVVETRKTKSGGYERYSIVVFKENMEEFIENMQKAFDLM